MKKIPIKSFTILPAICPANFKHDCGCCAYCADFLNLKNPSLHAIKIDFGHIRCTWDDYINSKITKEQRGSK
jgi:hypothetical protein